MSPLPLLTSSVEIVSAAPQHAFGSESGVLIASWRREIEMDVVRELLAYRDRMLKQHFIGAIHMAEEGVKLPPSEVRSAARAGVERRGDVRPGIALIIFGSGFGASAIRSVATAIFTLRAGPPTRIFDEVNGAASWLGERAALGGLEVGRLVSACETLRRAGLKQ